MKFFSLTIATAAAALLGGAAYAQQPAEPTQSSASTSRSADTPPANATVGATSTTYGTPAPAPAATTSGADVSTAATFTSMTVTNGPVPDTAENRAKYGQPLSRAGKRTAARGN